MKLRQIRCTLGGRELVHYGTQDEDWPRDLDEAVYDDGDELDDETLAEILKRLNQAPRYPVREITERVTNKVLDFFRS